MVFRIKKLLRLLLEVNFVRALLNGAAAGVEHLDILKNISTCNYVVDIGANRGQFALAARSVFPSVKIDSFEPLAEPAAIYSKVFADDALSQIHRFAIGNSRENLLIHVSQRNDSSSLLPISERQSDLFPGTEEKSERLVPVIPLKDAVSIEDIQSPALLKIDVQGYELTALEGCMSLLDRFDYIYVECSFIELYVGQSLATDVIEFLCDYRFKLTGVFNVHYDRQGAAIQGDFMFEKAK